MRKRARTALVLLATVVVAATVAHAQPGATSPDESAIPLGPRGAGERASAAPAPASSGGAVRTMIALAGVLTVAIGAAVSLRRLAQRSGGLWSAAGPGGRSPAGIIEVLGRYPFGRGQTLLLVRLDRRVLLVAQSSASRFASPTLATLTELTDPEDVASVLTKARDDEQEAAAGRFTSLVQRFDALHTRAAPTLVDLTRRSPGPSLLRDRLASLRAGRTRGVA